MKIGSKLKELRIAHGYTQAELATILNVSRSTISSWEINRTYPDLSMLVSLSELYNITVDQLINEDDKLVDTMTKETKRNMIFKRIILSLIVVVLSFAVVFAFLLRENHQANEEKVLFYEFPDYSKFVEKKIVNDNSIYYYKDNFVEEIIDTLPDGNETSLWQSAHLNTGFDSQVILKVKRDQENQIKKVSVVEMKDTIQLIEDQYGGKIHAVKYKSIEEANEAIAATARDAEGNPEGLVAMRSDDTHATAYFKVPDSDQ